MSEVHPAPDPLLDPVRVRIEFSTEATFITDVAGHLTWVAPTVATMLDSDPESLLGKRLRDLLDPVDAPRGVELREQLMALGPGEPAISTEPLRFVGASGRVVWCTVTARVVFDAFGSPIGITGAVGDVDELVRSRNSAAEANLLLHEALDAQEDPWVTAIAVRDEAGTIVDFRFEEVNRAAAAFHERPAEEIAGRTLIETYGLGGAATDIAAGAAVLASGEPLILNDQWSAVAAGHGRPPTWLDIRISPVGAERILYTWRVVTERYQAVQRQAETFQLLRAVMDAQIEPHAILRAVRDPMGEIIDFTYEDCNEAAAEFERKPRSALIGRTLHEVTPSPPDAETDVRDCREVLRTRSPLVQNDFITSYLRPDGRPIVIDGRIVPIDGERVSYSWRDVTDRFDDQRRRAESEERFRLLAGASSDVVYLAGLDGRITWVAPTITRSLGWAPSDWIGRLPGEFLHPDDLTRLAEFQGDADAADAAAADEALRIQSRDGTYRWMTMRREALFDGGHRLIGVSGALRDVDQIVRARLSIAEAHDALRAVLDNQVEPHTLMQAVRDVTGEIVDFRYLDANPSAAAFEGYSRELLLGRTFRETYASVEEAEEDIAYCRQVVLTGLPLQMDDEPTDRLDERGRRIIVDVRIAAVGGDLVSYQWWDVTDRYEAKQALQASEERFRLLAENMSDIVVLVTNGVIEWASPSVTRSLGLSPADLHGRSPADMMHPEDVLEHLSAWQEIDAGPIPRARVRVRDAHGEWHWMETSGSVLTSDHGRQVVMGGRLVDAEVEAHRALEAMAHHDSLTGLVNRHSAFDTLHRNLSGNRRHGTEMAVLFFDLDGFKEVNDQFGHTVGDVVLRTVAERVLQAVRGGDVVARIGGDEFLVLLQGLTSIEDAMAVAGKVREQVRRPVEIDGQQARVSASIGVSLAAPGKTVDDLVVEADRAMYEAKRAGKDMVVVAPTE